MAFFPFLAYLPSVSTVFPCTWQRLPSSGRSGSASSSEEIIKEGDDKAVFGILDFLDDKYIPQPRDLHQNALKGFFYDLSIRNGETYRQFITRYDTAVRKLKEQGVDLPSVVKGFMLLRKLKLDANQESMILSSTHGKMEIKEVIEEVSQSHFSGRKGATRKQDVFEALGQGARSRRHQSS